VATRRRKLPDDSSANTAALKTQDLIEQVCVPLIGDRKYVGAVVIRWQIGVTDWFEHRQLHDASDLQILGRIIGSLYSKHQMKKGAERSKQAVHTAGLYVFQHAHRMGNAVQTLYSIANLIKLAPDEEQRKIRIDQLEVVAENQLAKLAWIVDLGELMQDPIREAVSLSSLLKECWREIASSASVDSVTFFDEEVIAMADRKLLTEVFINLMTNAVQATQSKKATITNFRSELTVNAAVSEDGETVRITFKDNGAGMTRKQLDNALKGFSSSERPFGNVRHKGVGVLISQYLLGVQDGRLDFISKRGEGTEAIVTLPNFRNKRRRDEVAP
jgi:signal transduction histidine kinase